MARRGLSPRERGQRARVPAQRMIARGECPLYRVRMTTDGGWKVEWRRWLHTTTTSRSGALAASRAAVIAWLECDPNAIEPEVAG